MKLGAFIAALAAAVVGAIIWSWITIATHHEIGYVAWGVGAIIGIAAVRFGARGIGAAIICAGLAVVSIFVGKLMTVQHVVGAEIATQTSSMLTQQAYDERKEEARQFSLLTSEDQWPKFMMQHKYTEATKESDISSEDRDTFKEVSANLKKFQETQPAYESWKAERAAKLQELGGSFTLGNPMIIDATVHSLEGMDIVFGLLGIITAYRIVARASAAA